MVDWWSVKLYSVFPYDSRTSSEFRLLIVTAVWAVRNKRFNCGAILTIIKMYKYIVYIEIFVTAGAERLSLFKASISQFTVIEKQKRVREWNKKHFLAKSTYHAFTRIILKEWPGPMVRQSRGSTGNTSLFIVTLVRPQPVTGQRSELHAAVSYLIPISFISLTFLISFISLT